MDEASRARDLFIRFGSARVKVFEVVEPGGALGAKTVGDFPGLWDAIEAVAQRDPELMFDVQIYEPDGGIRSLEPSDLALLVDLVRRSENPAA